MLLNVMQVRWQISKNKQDQINQNHLARFVFECADCKKNEHCTVCTDDLFVKCKFALTMRGILPNISLGTDGIYQVCMDSILASDSLLPHYENLWGNCVKQFSKIEKSK